MKYLNEECDADTTYESIANLTTKCGQTYIGSLYHKIARYASQACIRPSEANNPLPATVLQDINTVMDEIRHEMSTSLADECQRLGGTWYDTIWKDDNTNTRHDTQNHWLHNKFYSDTAANTDWGYCGTDDETQAQTITTEEKKPENEPENEPQECTTNVTTNCIIPGITDENSCNGKNGEWTDDKCICSTYDEATQNCGT